jgi:hypothetical protein
MEMFFVNPNYRFYNKENSDFALQISCIFNKNQLF